MQNNYFKIKAVILLLFISFNIYGQLPQCERAVNFAELDINNVRARFWASGNMWFDPITTLPHYEVPKVSGKHSLYSFDFWLGAVDEMGRKRIVFQKHAGQWETGVRYFPGPLDEIGDTYIETCQYYDRIWKINKSTVDSFRLGLLAEIPKDILEWPAQNNPHISFSPNRELAPFIDVNEDQNYNPMDGDYPKILGDQALWWVFNDKGGYGSPFLDKTIQLEIQAMAYAYNSIPELQNHTFYKYVFTNKSVLRMDSMMIGMFNEADLGWFNDDYMGCDTLRNMGIIYNGDDLDGVYQKNIPIVGLKLLRGPQKIDGSHASMYTCWHRDGNPNIWGIPEFETQAYNGLWGLLKYGSPMTYNNESFLYMYPSDPTDENGWSECSEEHTPSDRKMFMSVGPFTLQPNQQKELHFAALFVRDSIEYPCPSFAPIQEAADYVQDLFDTGLITNIEEQPTASNKNTDIRLFPNPLKENRILTLQLQQQNFNSRLQKGTFQLYDNLGRLVESVTLRGERETQLQLSELQSGIYFYRLRWENGRVENGKLVVE